MVAGIACGVLCAACVLAYLTSVRGEADAARAEALARYGGEQVEVCVARRDVAAADVTWVTVAVKPESVQEVIAASRKAELYFALPAAGEGAGLDAREGSL